MLQLDKCVNGMLGDLLQVQGVTLITLYPGKLLASDAGSSDLSWQQGTTSQMQLVPLTMGASQGVHACQTRQDANFARTTGSYEAGVSLSI